MPDIAPGFLHLSDFAIRSGLTFPLCRGHYQVAYKLSEPVIQYRVGCTGISERTHLIILHERHALIVDENIVAKDANCHERQHIAQWPVTPVMTWAVTPATRIVPSAVASTQEVDVARIPHCEHPVLELLKVLPGPAVIVAHQLSSLSKLIAIEASSQRPVAVAADQLASTRPGHQDTHCCVSIGLCSFNLPTQGILVGHRSTTCSIDIVLARAPATYDGLHRPCLNVCLSILCIFQSLIGLFHLCIAHSQLLPDALEVSFSMQSARMDEATVGVIYTNIIAHIKDKVL